MRRRAGWTWLVVAASVAFASAAWAQSKECKKQCAMSCSHEQQGCIQKCPKPKDPEHPVDPQSGIDPGSKCQMACGQKIADCVRPCLDRCK